MLPQGGVQSSPIYYISTPKRPSRARTVGALVVGFFPLIRFDHLARTFRGTACVADVYNAVARTSVLAFKLSRVYHKTLLLGYADSI